MLLPILLRVAAAPNPPGLDSHELDEGHVMLLEAAHREKLVFNRGRFWRLSTLGQQWLERTGQVESSSGRLGNERTMIQATAVTRFQLKRLSEKAGITMIETLAAIVEQWYQHEFPEG